MKTFARLQRLTEPRGEHLEATFHRLSELLQDAVKEATVQVRILSEQSPRHWVIELKERSARVHTNALKRPDLEIVTREATWWEIADGRLSPLEAFRLGRLRLLGDTELGSLLLKRVAVRDSGAIAICGGEDHGNR